MVREENRHNYDEKISLLTSLILSFYFILFFLFYFHSPSVLLTSDGG